MTKTVWDIIEETKDGKPYVGSEEQYENLERVLSQMDRKMVSRIGEEWRKKTRELINNENYYKLHYNHGGIVDRGDDGFYMDFGNWVIAQGEELFQQFKKEGHEAILDYIKKNNVPCEDYNFECMIYAFHD